MEEILHNITSDSDNFTMFLIFGVGGVIGLVIAVIAIISGTMKSISQNSEYEKSRREVAAYIAEGSITPEDGERLLAVGKSTDGKGKCG